MGETEILDKLYQDLRLDLWWHDLLGQKPDFENFDIDKAIDTIPRTEIKGAEAVHRKFKDVLTYVEARNVWYLWDGRIHTPCAGNGIAVKVAKYFYKAMADALDFCKEYYDKRAKEIEAAKTKDSAAEAKAMRAQYDKGEIAKHKGFRDRLATDAGLSALVRVMTTECDVPTDYYDNDQQWFVFLNGVLDLNALREGQWRTYEHSPDRPVTKYFNANYDTVNLKHWDTFLERSIPCKPARDYLQLVVGAAFMGESKLRTILNLHGPPGSGKSVFIGTFFKLGKEGAGYAAMPDSKAIIKVSGQNFEQDSFKGRRYIGISEPPMNDPIDNEFLKKYTGDDWVETRTLNVKSAGWVPQGVIFVASNKSLKINTRDKAIVERVQLIEFPIEFRSGPDVPEDHRRIPNLENLILMDRSRVLMWVIQGMRKFVDAGLKLDPPPEVVALQNEVVTEASTALRFVKDFLDEGLYEEKPEEPLKYCVEVKEAYNRYKMWVLDAGERKPLTLRFFTEDVSKRYGEVVRDGKVMRFKGLVSTLDYKSRFGENSFLALAGQ